MTKEKKILIAYLIKASDQSLGLLNHSSLHSPLHHALYVLFLVLFCDLYVGPP